MRFLHLADLHFGKSIYGTSLLENKDQEEWLSRFLALAGEIKPEAVLIAGDVYDRSAPSGDAVELLNRMLTRLSELRIPVLLCAGNHDSVQRLSFLSPLLSKQGLHISPPLTRSPVLEHVTLQDDFGPVTFWLLPYAFPALIARALGEEKLRDGTDAVRELLSRQPVDKSGRNVLLAHLNVTAGGVEGLRGGSESMVGGVGQIDYRVFDDFDYVALGHIHAAYPVGRESVRYAGSPLCYHFNETRQPQKGPLLVELGEKGSPVSVHTLVIPPLHPMRELRGSFQELWDAELESPRRGEYLRVVLTDQRVSPEIAARFRELCDGRDSVLMELCSEYARQGIDGGGLSRNDMEEKSVEELFADFYAERSGGVEPTEADRKLLSFAGELLRRAAPHSVPTGEEIGKLLDFLTRQEENA